MLENRSIHIALLIEQDLIGLIICLMRMQTLTGSKLTMVQYATHYRVYQGNYILLLCLRRYVYTRTVIEIIIHMLQCLLCGQLRRG